MWPFQIELVEEVVEAGLLLQGVHAWGPGCFLLQGEMHALVAAVLLGMAWLDAFDVDAEAEPPNRKLGEVEEGIGTGEGDAIVGANGLRQAAIGEKALEGGKSDFLARSFEGFAHEQEEGRLFRDRERIAVSAVAELELAFEVGAPQIVRGDWP